MYDPSSPLIRGAARGNGPPAPKAKAMAANRGFVDRIDGLLLGAINPFTARHLRKLWHHSARITGFLKDNTAAIWFRRSDVAALAVAILAGDRQGVEASRLFLIASQETFFLRKLLKSEAPLTPGSGVVGGWTQTAAPNRRET